MRPADLRTLGHWLSPDYVIPAAEAACPGDPVAGAGAAYDEVRGLIRSYLRYMAQRDGTTIVGTGCAIALRVMGYGARRQKVTPIEASEWRRSALAAWEESPGILHGWGNIEVGDVTQSTATRAVLCVLATTMRTFPALNRAILRGRVYERHSTEMLVTIGKWPEEVGFFTVDPLRQPIPYLDRAMRRAMKALLRTRQSEFMPVFGDLFRAWLRAGFIISPASAVVTQAPFEAGFSALIPGNGIPLAVLVGLPRNGRVSVCITADHRALDGHTLGILQHRFESELKTFCGQLEGR